MKKQILEIKNITKLNIGCGMDIKEGFLNVDISPHNEQVMKIDLESPLPFEDNTFDYVYASHVIEHVKNYDSLMNELWRVCKENAIIDVVVPHFTSTDAFQPSHAIFFGSNAFDYFESKEKGRNHPSVKINLKVLQKKMTWAGGINPLNYIGRIFNNSKLMGIYENTFLRCVFPAKYIYFKLKIIK